MDQTKALFLDFDGTIIDSEWLHYECWIEIIGPLGLSFTFEEYDRTLTGQTDIRAAGMFLTMAGQEDTPDARVALRNKKREVFRRRNRQELRLGEGIVDAVAGLASEIPVGLVTSSVRAEVEPILQDQGLYDHLLFHVYGDDVTKHKPDPEPYAIALRKLQTQYPSIQPGEVLVLEDSHAGHTSADAVGLRVRLVKSPKEAAAILAALVVPTI